MTVCEEATAERKSRNSRAGKKFFMKEQLRRIRFNHRLFRCMTMTFGSPAVIEISAYFSQERKLIRGNVL
jgi:hypothetical protein